LEQRRSSDLPVGCGRLNAVTRKLSQTKAIENTIKMNITMTLLAVCGALALTAGCNEQCATAPQAIKDATAADDAAAQAAEAQKQAEVAKAAEAAKVEAMKQQAETEKLAADKAAAEKAAIEKAAAEKAAADKLAQAAAAAQEQSRIQGLIDTAKNLTGQSKYAEALKTLSELASLKLSPEQKALVDTLKTAAEKQAAQAAVDKAAAEATNAVGDVIGGPK
jgi:hypothetical protein